MNVQDFVLLALNSVSGLVDAEIDKLGADIGAAIKDQVASSKTQFDDYAKARVTRFLAAVQAAAA